MGGISIAKKIVLYIFLVFTTLGAIPRDTYGATSCVFQVIQKKVTISMKNATLETILSKSTDNRVLITASRATGWWIKTDASRWR